MMTVIRLCRFVSGPSQLRPLLPKPQGVAREPAPRRDRGRKSESNAPHMHRTANNVPHAVTVGGHA